MTSRDAFSGEATDAHREPNINKENEAPSTAGAASKTGQGSSSSTSKPKSPSTKKGPSTSSPDRSNLPENYLDIVLEEKDSKGLSESEVPCYEDVREFHNVSNLVRLSIYLANDNVTRSRDIGFLAVVGAVNNIARPPLSAAS